MAYQIEYSPQEQCRYPLKSYRKKRSRSIIWMLILMAIASFLLSHYGIPDLLIPGDAEVTKSAAQEMIWLLKTGTPVKDAFEVFCKQIIDAAVI